MNENPALEAGKRKTTKRCEFESEDYDYDDLNLIELRQKISISMNI
jgi:hypothetical protein